MCVSSMTLTEWERTMKTVRLSHVCEIRRNSRSNNQWIIKQGDTKAGWSNRAESYENASATVKITRETVVIFEHSSKYHVRSIKHIYYYITIATQCSMVADDSLLGQYLRLETPVEPVTRRGLFLRVIDKPRVSCRERMCVRVSCRGGIVG